jgi:hypothetical protein
MLTSGLSYKLLSIEAATFGLEYSHVSIIEKEGL